jgi:hypothetical protein
MVKYEPLEMQYDQTRDKKKRGKFEIAAINKERMRTVFSLAGIFDGRQSLNVGGFGHTFKRNVPEGLVSPRIGQQMGRVNA